MKKHFPIKGKTHTLEVSDLILDDNLATNDFPAQKEIKLKRRSWVVPVYGTVTLKDNKTGEIIDQRRKMKLANVPKLTNRFSTIIKGNEYQTVNQFRLKPGIYTRIKSNKELESRFNLAKGYNFTMIMDPAKGIFHLVLGNKKYHVYNLLSLLGVQDSNIKKIWKAELFDKNKSASLTKEAGEIFDLYEKLLRKKAPSEIVAREGLIEYFENTQISPDTTKLTLGQSFDRVTGETILQASRKLLAVMREEEPPDERDSLAFKELNTLDDLLGQYFKAQKAPIANRLKYQIDRKNSVDDIISASTYSKPIRDFFTVSDLTSTPAQTNPLDIVSQWRKTTIMGTGGVKSRHAITLDVRDVHPSHISFLDSLDTPESSKIGVTVGMGIDAEKHDKELKTHILNKAGNKILVTPTQLYDMKIGFGDQYVTEAGKPISKNPMVKGYYRGKPQLFQQKDIDGYILNPANMFSYASNLIPFLHHNSGNRGMTASRQMAQAIPLKDREAPMVRPMLTPDKEFGYLVGNFLNPMPGKENEGTVTKITDDYIHIKRNKDNKTVKIGLYNKFPLNQESFLQSIPTVKIGDKVKKDTVLAENNFNKDGTLALGTNVRVAYMPWHGLNFEDSSIVTESFAKKLTSTALIKKTLLTKRRQGILDKKKFRVYYPNLLSMDNATKLDSQGIAKEGEVFQPGQIVASYMEEVEETPEEKLLRLMNKGIARPYRPKVLKWDHDRPGKVTYVNQTGRILDIHLEVENPLDVGDKLAGSHGNKTIVSRIIPDEEAPHTLDGKRIDLILNPHGVPGRMNIGQLIETAAGKIVEKTGEPYQIKNFSGINYTKKILADLKKNKIEPDEILVDGKDGKRFKNPVFTGIAYFHKLRHTVEHKEKARSAGTFEQYDINKQPSKGVHGPQSLDSMQVNSYLGHGARINLAEATALKGGEQSEYWRSLMLGLPVPKPTENFVFDKMVNYLKGASVNVEKHGDRLQLLPLLDEDVKNMSSGELLDAGAMLKGKNLIERKDGLFDKKVTGGMTGKNWAHIKLQRKIPNPMFKDAIVKILGITGTKYESILARKDTLGGKTGTEAIETALGAVNADELLSTLKEEIKGVPENRVNYYNKRIRYLRALKKFKLKPEQYMMEYVPVVPPTFRPVYNLPSGDLMHSPVNHHYRNVALVNQAIKEADEAGWSKDKTYKDEHALYKAVEQMQGLVEPSTYAVQKYEGLVGTLIGRGKSPKMGFIQNKVWSKGQDLSARSTITLDPSLGIDEVGVPDSIAKVIYKPFVVQHLVRRGLDPADAIKHVKDWTPLADSALNVAMEERPVLLNRAPSLHKFNVQAFKPKRVAGKSLMMNALVSRGFSMDYDGDTMSVSLPITRKAIEEAQNIVPSKTTMKHGDYSLVPAITQEYMLGLYFLTRDGKNTGKTFNTVSEAKNAGLEITDVFLLNGKRTTLGRLMVDSVLPEELRDPERTFHKGTTTEILTRVAKEYKNDFAQVINSFKDLGNQYSHESGATVSLTDMDLDRTYRDKILAQAEKAVAKDPSKIVEIYMKAGKEIEKAQDRVAGPVNRMYDMLHAGSLKKKSQVGQLLSMPGIFADVHNNPIPIPVTKSYGEGLDSFDYWSSMYGARKGAVDKAVNTAETGALNKALLSVNKSLLITEEDCDTSKGLEMPLIDKDVIDRCLARTYPGIGEKNDIVDGEILDKARAKGLNSLLVRSALTCESATGVCVFCYGLGPDGEFPNVGENVGIEDSQAITERATQLTLSSFHYGGTAEQEKSVSGSFPELVRLLEVPQTIPNKAVLATKSGIVENVKSNPAGGVNVFISGKEYHVPHGKDLTVKIGDRVKKGEMVSAGRIKPQELGELKDHLTAQRYLVDQMNDIYNDSFRKKTFETVVRGVSNNARVTSAPEDTGYIRGDVASITYLDKLNKERQSAGLDEIKYKPFFKSIQTWNTDNEDWLSRLTANRLKQTITEGAGMGMASNIHGHDPMPAYLYGLEFGQSEDPAKY